MRNIGLSPETIALLESVIGLHRKVNPLLEGGRLTTEEEAFGGIVRRAESVAAGNGCEETLQIRCENYRKSIRPFIAPAKKKRRVSP